MDLIEKARAYAADSGKLQIPFMHVFISADKEFPMPKAPIPYIFFILDGELRLYTPIGIMDYIAGQYSVSAIDTPERGHVLAFSKQQDFLAAVVEFTANDLLNIVISLEDELVTRIFADDLADELKLQHDQCVISCLERLLDTVNEPLSMRFLGEQSKRELLFHVLCGSCGKASIQSITNLQAAGEIYKANSWIKQNYRQSFKVEELAEQWNMSVSQFHQKFKHAVGMGPLQCQKRLRLTESRRLMLDQGKTATEAAFDVGYESLSQFTREYRKMFGKSPSEDVLFWQKSQ